MRLRVFQSSQGDCLLLEGKTSGRVLCDGGMAKSMRERVLPVLGKLRANNEKIDVAYVSHVDADHIGGILELLETEAEWRTYEFQKSSGNKKAKKPKNARPPEIGTLWQNAFRDQVELNQGDVEDLLAVAVPQLLASNRAELEHTGLALANVALGVNQALDVSRLVDADALNIPVNKLDDAGKPPRLLIADKQTKSIKVGSMNFRLLGPSEDELTRLRAGWNKYLKLKNKKDFKWESEDGVTMANVASVMFLVEEGEKLLLLTGDGIAKYIIQGLERLKLLDAHGSDGLHVDVLKVQHHGSEHNLDESFCRRVSADTYIFCGNGHSTNPEIKVIREIFASRLGPENVRALAPKAEGRPFRFVFSTNADLEDENVSPKKQIAHMRKVEEEATRLVAKSNGLLTCEFNQKAFIDVAI